MPLYEYECTKCGRRVEVIQKFSDAPRTRCETCKGPLKKLPSAPAIHFKGTGWYVTDYGKGKGSAALARDAEKSDKSDKSEKSEKTDKSEKKTEKPKSESKKKSGEK